MGQEGWYDEQTICCWEQLVDRFNWHSQVAQSGSKPTPQWLFRGQREACWRLKTSLERAFEMVPNPGAVVATNADLELGLLRKFRRECHRFGLSSTPAEDDRVEWFAWMQHHGAPTRLLDCTYSLFVAVFFALEEAEGTSAVWAFDVDKMRTGLAPS